MQFNAIRQAFFFNNQSIRAKKQKFDYRIIIFVAFFYINFSIRFSLPLRSMTTPLIPRFFYCSLLYILAGSLHGVETEVVIRLDQSPEVLEVADLSGANSNPIHFGPLGAEFRGSGNAGRNFLRTTEDGFGETDFEASVVWNGSGQMFFGIGGGAVGAYGTPDWGVDRNDSIWLEMLPNGDSTLSRISNANRIEMPRPFAQNYRVNRPTRVIWRYSAEEQSVRFIADTDYSGGSFIADLESPPIATKDLFEAGEAFRIYFGGEGGTVSEAEIHYIPEPASTTLVFAVMSGFLIALRRRHNGPSKPCTFV